MLALRSKVKLHSIVRAEGFIEGHARGKPILRATSVTILSVCDVNGALAAVEALLAGLLLDQVWTADARLYVCTRVPFPTAGARSTAASFAD